MLQIAGGLALFALGVVVLIYAFGLLLLAWAWWSIQWHRFCQWCDKFAR